MDVDFHIDPEEFQQRKRRRMSAMNNAAPPPPKVAPTSAPGVHEVATFLPGRLEFEHELDNEAEELVKDLEFGICLAYGGDQIIEDENDVDVKARAQMLEERKSNEENRSMSQPPTNGVNGYVNGHSPVNGDTSRPHSIVKSEEPSSSDQQTTGEDDPNSEEPMQPPPFETEDSLAFKLTMIEMYNQRVAKRHEAKSVMFERGLLEYKKVGCVWFSDVYQFF
jgi:transcriptional adapter 2-alpha